jgi:hypothetical protein
MAGVLLCANLPAQESDAEFFRVNSMAGRMMAMHVELTLRRPRLK